MTACLYLIPTPIGGKPENQLPLATQQKIFTITYFIAERAKTARRFLKSIGHPVPLSEIEVREIPKKREYFSLEEDMKPLKTGISIGLMSEAGSPGVADPGADLVLKAHEWGVEVVPLVGPSSLLMALMASGLNGQQFSFHGYLSAKKNLIGRDLKRLEGRSKADKGCHFFIETPYRNMQIFESALEYLHTTTLFSVQCDLNNDNVFSKTQSVGMWRKSPKPNLHKKPCVFLLQSS